jgi:hypothetical protein
MKAQGSIEGRYCPQDQPLFGLAARLDLALIVFRILTQSLQGQTLGRLISNHIERDGVFVILRCHAFPGQILH